MCSPGAWLAAGNVAKPSALLGLGLGICMVAVARYKHACGLLSGLLAAWFHLRPVCLCATLAVRLAANGWRPAEERRDLGAEHSDCLHLLDMVGT